MRKSVLAALLAATILVPAAANAQDQDRNEGRAHGEGRGPRQQGQPQQQAPQQRGGGEDRAQREFQRPQPAQPQPQAQAQMQVQPQGDRGDRGGGRQYYRGFRPDGDGAMPVRGGYRGGGQPQTQQAPPQQFQQPQVQQQARPQDRPDRGGDFRDGRRGFRGNDDRPGLTAQNYRGPDGRGDERRGPPPGGYANRGYDNRGYDNRGYDPRANRGYGGYTNGGWNRDWRRDARYNYSVYRNQNRNVFHLPRYYAPRGWNYGYRRFDIGFTLSSFLYDQDYWIDDPDYYRLPPAYGPYRWVRYYNDALLVDLRTGYVVDTVYDIFW